MPTKRTLQAYPIVGKPGTQRAREQEPLEFLSSKRIRMNIAAVLEDNDLWLTPAYSLAIQAEHLLQVVEGKRTHTQRVRGKARKWGVPGRAELLRCASNGHTPEKLAELHGCSVSAIKQQLVIARREAAE